MTFFLEALFVLVMSVFNAWVWYRVGKSAGQAEEQPAAYADGFSDGWHQAEVRHGFEPLGSDEEEE